LAFFWFQKTGGEEQWAEALAEHRPQITRDVKPAFVTVLDAHSSPESSWGPDEYAKMKYSGPLYFDWDAEDVAETIPKFQQFLVKLQEDYGVNLRSLRLYATGGRGFHCEIPVETFTPKFPKAGVTNLPYVYREMAMELVVDTMDMRVYTGRKGRMWRTPGVKRDNGKYKVPLTVDQALAMTTELYADVCSEPRVEPERDIPVLSIQLAALFVKSQGKIEEAMKRRAKSSGDAELLAKFKGDWPPTVQRIMAGEGIAPGIGFQRIATQLAITANALGKSAKDLMEACDGLVKNHSSDSQRYNSPRKRATNCAACGSTRTTTRATRSRAVPSELSAMWTPRPATSMASAARWASGTSPTTTTKPPTTSPMKSPRRSVRRSSPSWRA
jgi:hypothetical protein